MSEQVFIEIRNIFSMFILLSREGKITCSRVMREEIPKIKYAVIINPIGFSEFLIIKMYSPAYTSMFAMILSKRNA